MNQETIHGAYSAMFTEKISPLAVKGWACRLHFTNDRIAAIENQGIAGRLELNKGFQPLYNQSTASAREKIKMSEVSIDNLIKSGPRNFSIPCNEISRIESGKYSYYTTLKIFGSNNLNVPKYVFLFKGREVKSFFDFLDYLLPDLQRR